MVLFLTLIMQVSGVTITMGQGGGYDYSKIQDAIDSASIGDEIIVYPGRYVERIHLKGKNRKKLLCVPVTRRARR